MGTNATYITTATIRFCENIYRLPGDEKYVWITKLEDCPMCTQNNRMRIYLSDCIDKSEKMVDDLRHHFALNHIFNTSKVSIIFDDNGIIAIGTIGMDNYLDIRDDLKIKTFSQLDVNITSLIITA